MSGGDTQTSTQSQSSATSPWSAAQPLLTNLLGSYGGQSTAVTPGQTAANNTLTAGAGAIPTDMGSQSSGALNNLFSSSTAPQVGMLTSALSGFNTNMTPLATASTNPYDTPGFSDALNTMTNDITNQVKSTYAGSGRDPSGAGSFAQSLGRGLTQGEAPTIAAQYNANVGNVENANNAMLTGNTSTANAITGQNQVPLTNDLAGISAAPTVGGNYMIPGTAQSSAANAAYQTPWTNLSALLQPATQLGSMGSQSTGTGTSTTTQPQNMLSNIMGGVAGGTGILSSMGAFGPAGWLLAA